MKNSELEFGQRMVHTRGNIDDEAVGKYPLGHCLTANQRLMCGGNVEHRRIDQIGNSKLPQNRGAPRRNTPLDLEIPDIHLTSPYTYGANSVVRRRPRRKSARPG